MASARGQAGTLDLSFTCHSSIMIGEEMLKMLKIFYHFFRVDRINLYPQFNFSLYRYSKISLRIRDNRPWLDDLFFLYIWYKLWYLVLPVWYWYVLWKNWIEEGDSLVIYLWWAKYNPLTSLNSWFHCAILNEDEWPEWRKWGEMWPSSSTGCSRERRGESKLQRN